MNKQTPHNKICIDKNRFKRQRIIPSLRRTLRFRIRPLSNNEDDGMVSMSTTTFFYLFLQKMDRVEDIVSFQLKKI